MEFAYQRQHQEEESLQEILTRQMAHYMDQEYVFANHQELVWFFQAYKNWRALLKKPPRRSFEQDILHYCIQNFYWLRLPYSSVVADLLRCTHLADGSFHVLFFPDESCPSFNFVNVSSEHPMPLEYFLFHAYQERLTFNGMRMASAEVYHSGWKTPCELAIENRSPELLKLILRYGSLLNPGDNGPPPSTRNGTVNGMEKMMKLLRVCVRTLARLNPEWVPFESLAPEHSAEYEAVAHCGRLLLRMCPHFTVHRLFRQLNSRTMPSFSQMHEYVEKLKGDLPALPFRCIQPLDLKHACRLHIRQALHNNWQLPMGLRCLDLPATLKGYLDLQED